MGGRGHREIVLDPPKCAKVCHTMADILGDLSLLCVSVNTGPGELCITFPGGATLCAQAGYDFGDPAAITRALFAQVNSSLMPLTPMFNTIDVAMKIVECIKAIPATIGPPPDPTALAKALPGLLEALEKLVAILPPLSIPKLVVDIIRAIVMGLIGLKGELTALIRQQARIIELATKAAKPGNIVLLSVLDCATQNFDAQLANLNTGLAPLNRLIGVVNALMEMAGLKPLPALDDLGDDPEAALSILDDFIDVLQTASAAIPL